MKRSVLFAAAVAATVSAVNAEPIQLVSHRAQYDVTLAANKPGGMVAVQGHTVLEFRDVCTGWTTTQRFIADMTDAKASTVHSDFIVSSSEDKQGKQIRFKLSNFINGKRTQRFDGTAFRLLGVGVSHIEPQSACDPADLVDDGAAKRAAAERAMDKVRAKFGGEVLVKGRARSALRR